MHSTIRTPDLSSVPTPGHILLRPYQSQAVAGVLSALEHGAHPVVSLPTGSGKSLVCAALCSEIPGRILVASHRQELLEQDALALTRYNPLVPWGIYSAGLKRRDTQPRVIFAGVQSAYNKMDLLQAAGPFAAVIVDECHLVAPKEASTIMYQQVFAACPGAQRVGLSATPYRLDSGLLYTGPGAWYDRLACDISMRTLTPEYLSPLKGILTAHNIDTSGVHVQAGEFVQSELAQKALQEDVLSGAVAEICLLGTDRQSWLLFCVDVAHTMAVADALRARGIRTGVVLGHTPQEERRETLAAFKAGKLRAIANCAVLTTGFDHPGIDLVAMLRPTMSKGLVVQCLGRGARQAAGKVDCLVLDYAGNIARHAPLDELWETRKSAERVAQEEREAREAHEAARTEQHDRHDRQASLLDPLSGLAPERAEYRVLGVTYEVRVSKGRGRPMLVVKYHTPDRKRLRPQYPPYLWQWVLVEYEGWPRRQAEQWFARRGLPSAPRTAAEALARAEKLPCPVSLLVQEKVEPPGFPEIVLEYFEATEG